MAMDALYASREGGISAPLAASFSQLAPHCFMNMVKLNRLPFTSISSPMQY